MQENYNQQNFYEQSNAKLDKRTFEFATTRPSILMDNNKLYDQKSSYNNQSNNYLNKNKNVGEITGDLLEISTIDKGMPLRSNCNYSKKKNIEDEKGHSRYTDFDIFEEDKLVDMNISYYDPDGGKMCSFEDMMEESSLQNSDPMELSNYVINDYNWYMFENIINLVQGNVFYSTISIIYLMSILYIASKGQCESDLLNYFKFPEKQTLFNGLQEINSYISKSQCLDIKNIFLISNSYKLNDIFLKHCENLISIYQINNNLPEIEANKVNI